MHIVNFSCKNIRILLFGKHNFKEIYFVEIKSVQSTPVLSQNKLLAISLLNYGNVKT